MSQSNDIHEINGTSRREIASAIVALLVVICGGTAGYTLIEGWDLWQSLFFTLITITTVGYGDEGLSLSGERFTLFLLLGGISTATYAAGVIIKASVRAQLAWRGNMRSQIARLENHYIICGFGRIGRTVCQRLRAASITCVVIEGDRSSVEDARERGFLAICGNATEDETLHEAGIKRARGIVAAVNSDSDNIVITLGAREMRPDISIIARVDEEGAQRKIRRAGANHIVSPFKTGAVDIAQAIIQPNVAEFLGSGEKGGGFELSEATVNEHSPFDGLTIAQAKAGGGKAVVVVALKDTNGGTLLGPNDMEILKAGDTVILAGDPEQVNALCDSLTGTKNSGRKRKPLTSWGPGPE